MLKTEPPMLDIVVFNNTDSRFVVTVYLTASGENQSNNDGRTVSTPIKIGPQEEIRREEFAESQQYLIEYDVDKIVDGDPLQTDHDHAISIRRMVERTQVLHSILLIQEILINGYLKYDN
jgi:hypothetical protein